MLTGGERDGAVVQPTVLIDLPHDHCLWNNEAFAPIVSIEPFDDIDTAVSLANAIDYSLHAGIFTKDLDRALDILEGLKAADPEYSLVILGKEYAEYPWLESRDDEMAFFETQYRRIA